MLWKAKKIARVCDSTKTAETLSMDKCCDDAIYMARMIQEIYSGKPSLKQIPVVLFTDSKPLFESIYSTKQVDRKTVRHIIQMMKDSVSRGEVQTFKWIETKAMIADVFTKESAPTELIKEVLDQGRLNIWIHQSQRQNPVGEDCQPHDQLVTDKSASNHSMCNNMSRSNVSSVNV